MRRELAPEINTKRRRSTSPRQWTRARLEMPRRAFSRLVDILPSHHLLQQHRRPYRRKHLPLNWPVYSNLKVKPTTVDKLDTVSDTRPPTPYIHVPTNHSHSLRLPTCTFECDPPLPVDSRSGSIARSFGRPRWSGRRGSNVERPKSEVHHFPLKMTATTEMHWTYK